MTDLRPLSELTERLQTLAKSKHDDSIFTGSEFKNAYGAGLDENAKNQVAFAGGDLQTAYSNLHSAYMVAKNANEDNRNEFKVKGEAEQSLNPEVVSGKIGHAIEHLLTAAGRLAELDDSLDANGKSVESEAREIANHLTHHKERIEATGMVVLN